MISALILTRRHSPRQCNRLVARCHGFPDGSAAVTTGRFDRLL